MLYTCLSCKVEKDQTEFRESMKYKKGFTSTCKPCESDKNKDRRRKKKLDEIKTLEDYLLIKMTNMRRMDSKRKRVVLNYPTVDYLKEVINRYDNKCVYTGVKLEWHPSADMYHRGSFDRIYNDLGHEMGNLQIVSLAANLLRGSRTHQEFVAYLDGLEVPSDDEDYIIS